MAGVPPGDRAAAGPGSDGRLHHDDHQRPQGLRHRFALAPESEYQHANVLAFAMWQTAFAGGGNFGVGSAIAVFIFLLVLPVLLLNIRRFRREV
jgi:ABC-type sugar transport systems, permease components